MPSDTPQASYWYETDAELSAALEAAEENAKSEWEEQFVSDQTAKAEKYGLSMYMTENQYEHLRRIAER